MSRKVNELKREAVFLFILMLTIRPWFASGEADTPVVHSFSMGVWVLTKVITEDQIYQPPTRFTNELPSFNFHEDGTVTIGGMEKSEVLGTWDYDVSDKKVLIQSENRKPVELSVLGRTMLFQKEDLTGQIAFEQEYSPLEDTDPVGLWFAVDGTDEKGAAWRMTSSMEQLELASDGTARIFTQDNNAKTVKNQEGVWARVGNDIIFSVPDKSDSLEKTYFPFRFYQLKQHFLIQYLEREGEERVAILRAKSETTQEDEVVISDLKPFCNTIWDYYANEDASVMVPAELVGRTEEDYIQIDGDGKVTIIQSGASYGEAMASVENGLLRIVFTGGSDFYMSMTKDGYLKVLTGEYGNPFYYRRRSEE